MKKRKGKKVYIRSRKMKLPVFDYTIHFIETDDFNLAIEHFHLKSSTNKERATAITWRANCGSCGYIFIKPKAPINVIVHECVHVVYHVLVDRGAELSDEENFAYHLDYVVKHAMKFYKKEK